MVGDQLNYLGKNKILFINGISHKYYEYIINSGLYLSGSVAQILFAFFSQPFYARYLSAEDYGILGYYTSVQGFFTPLFLFGMTQFYLMNYFRKSTKENKETLFNILFMLSIVNVIISVLGCVGLKIIYRTINISVPLMPFAVYIFIILYFNVYSAFLLINLRIRKKAILFFIFTAVPPALNVFWGLIFVILFKMGAAGKLLGQSITNLTIGLLSVYYLRKFITFKITLNFEFIRKSFPHILPLIGAAYAYYPIKSIDRIFLERLSNISELGYYSLGLIATNFINVACLSIFMAIEPDIYRLIIQKSYGKLIRLSLLYFLIVFSGVVLFILVSPYLMEFLTNGRFTRAYKYANVNAIGVLFMQVYFFANSVLIAVKRTKETLYINLFGGISALILYYIMIQKYQFQGANYTYVIISILMATSSILLIIFARKKNIEHGFSGS